MAPAPFRTGVTGLLKRIQEVARQRLEQPRHIRR